MVLGEARNFVDFEADEFEKLASVASGFDPQPYLAFATLKDRFGDGEKRMIQSLVDRGHRLRSLTRLELDPYDLYDRFLEAPHRYAVRLSELSENLVHLKLRS